MRIIWRIIKLPWLLLTTLESIDGRLRSLEGSAKRFDACIDHGTNHRGRYCLRTGHWND